MLVNLDVHAIGIEQKDTMSTGRAVLVVHGVVSVQIAILRDTERVARPESTGIVLGWQTEAIRVFAETVQVGILWQRSLDAEVLRLEDQWVGGGVEELLASLFADDLEGEGLLLELEFEIRLADVVRVGTREDRLGNLIPSLCSVLDNDMETVLCSSC